MHGSHGAGGCRIIPEAKMREFPRPDKTIPRVPRGNHQEDWINAVRANKQAGSPFDYGGALTEIGLLGMVAIRNSGQRLEWNAETMKFTNNEAANAFIGPTLPRRLEEALGLDTISGTNSTSTLS